ncbi:DUF4142 domain-containing protein [Kutzneria albida]|nr:DUF4142 domain-containing protein [Kutzneria albida]
MITAAMRRRAAMLVVGLGVLSAPLAGCASGTTQVSNTANTGNPLDVGTEVTQTQWGPLGPADRLMLVKVRLAGAWELPSGEMALKKGVSQAVRDAGTHLIDGHTELNATDTKIAAELNVPIPTTPLPEQQGFLTEMTNASGTAFDKFFAGVLRDQHGAVYQLLAQVRAGTRNSMIRDFANRCMVVVLDHITMMERTGLVNYEALPSPTAPPPVPVPTAAQVTSSNNTSLGVFVIAAVMAAGAIAVPFVRRLRPKKKPSIIPE